MTRPPRRLGPAAGFAIPAVLFLAIAAYLGFENGHRFIDNAIVATLYGLFSVGLAAVPLLVWHGSTKRSTPVPSLTQSGWAPWMFTAAQGVSYSTDRDGGHLIVLALGWGVVAGAGTVTLYLLGHTLQPTSPDTAAKASTDGPSQ